MLVVVMSYRVELFSFDCFYDDNGNNNSNNDRYKNKKYDWKKSKKSSKIESIDLTKVNTKLKTEYKWTTK